MLVAAAAAETNNTSAWAPMWNTSSPESVTDASGSDTANKARPVSCSRTDGQPAQQHRERHPDHQRGSADDEGLGDHGVNR